MYGTLNFDFSRESILMYYLAPVVHCDVVFFKKSARLIPNMTLGVATYQKYPKSGLFEAL